MTKTKGLRKTKHGKRHSRKIYGGGDKTEMEAEDKLTRLQAEKRVEEIEKTKRDLAEEKPFYQAQLKYLNEYIEIQKIPIYQMGKTKKMKALDDEYSRYGANTELGNFINIIKFGGLTQNGLNQEKEKIESQISNNEKEIETLKNEKKELEENLKDLKHNWKCGETASKNMKAFDKEWKIERNLEGTYNGPMKRDKNVLTHDGKAKCLPDGKGTWTSSKVFKNEPAATIEGTWNMGEFVDKKEGGKKKRSKKTQRKRKRKHRASSRH